MEGRIAVPEPAQPPEPAHIQVVPAGAVTLPSEVVRAAGCVGGETLSLQIDRGEQRPVPATQSAPVLQKQPLIDLYNDFAPVREEVLESGISEDELFALIDEAITASRRERSNSSG